MNEQKKAWIYCQIDAPEDVHGTLKHQRQQLMDYAEQMHFSVVGSSLDVGDGTILDWPGLVYAEQAAQEAKMEVLLMLRLPRVGAAARPAVAKLRAIQALGVEIYSPMEGKMKVR